MSISTEKIRDFYNKMVMSSESTEMWNGFLKQIRGLILTDDIKEFSSWAPIRQTMNAGTPNFGFSKDHYDLLKKHKNWDKWNKIIELEKTASAVNHLFYISKFEDFVKPINNFDLIFEFGAGFGNMCRVSHKLGFNGKYIIYDFPELLAIQKYYLSNYNIQPNLCNKIDDLELSGEKSLCISTHALEEAPVSVMNNILDKVKDFSAFLFVFSGGKDRFEEFVNNNGIDYSLIEFPTLKGHYIIVGRKND